MISLVPGDTRGQANPASLEIRVMFNDLISVSGRSAVSSVSTSVPTSASNIRENSQFRSAEANEGAVAVSGKNMAVPQSPAPAATSEDVMEAVHKMRDYMQIIDRDLHFTVDEDSGVTVVKVVDPSTDEVVRQIPTEEVMRVVRSLENGGGFLSEIKA